MTINFKPKAIQRDEFEIHAYGRMSAYLGVEIPSTNGPTRPSSSTRTSTRLPKVHRQYRSIEGQTSRSDRHGDGTQIWKITHNGVDTHPIHFHLFNVQVLNRVGWDGMIKPPEPTSWAGRKPCG